MIDILNNEKYIVFDDIYDNNLKNDIENDFINSSFPWYLSNSLSTATKESIEKFSFDQNISEYLMFVHVFYDNHSGDTVANSAFIPILNKILNPLLTRLNLNSINLLRSKANLQTQHKNNTPNNYNTPHTDVNQDHYVAIYYVNDSDGDTVLFDEDYKIIQRISPKKGRVILFDGQTLHCGSHPYSSKSRCIVNIDFTI